MQTVSSDFNNAFKQPIRSIFVRVKMAGKNYTEKDINDFTIDYGSMGGATFQIGAVFSNSIKLEFCTVIEGLKELDEIEVEMGIMTYEAIFPTLENKANVGHAKVGKAKLVSFVPSKYEFTKIGKFYIDSVDPNRDDKTTTVEAFDGFTFMESTYLSKLKYPASIRDVALEIANLSGTKIDEVSFGRLSTTKIAQPKGYSYRQAIGLIAQFEAGFATFNKDGLLEMRTLSDPKFNISPNEYFMKGLKKSEILYRLGGLSCRVRDEKGEETELHSGTKAGAQIELENNVMTQSLLDSIYNKIKDINYYPYNLNWRGNPALEVGDWLTLTDTMGTKFKVPNLSYQLTFNGGLTATSSADTTATSEKVSKYKGSLDQKLNDIYVQIDAAGKNNIYRGLDEPEYPKEGDLWFKPNGPDKEIWVYTKNEDGTFAWKLETSTALDDDIREQIENATPSDEIVKTINLSDEMDGKEWLKINGAKLWLTDQTKIDNAIITSAMIADINAGKINTGTLNAADVNIINLNADSIVTGTLRGISLYAEDSNFSIAIEKGSWYLKNKKNAQDIKGTPEGILFTTPEGYKRRWYAHGQGMAISNIGLASGTGNAKNVALLLESQAGTYIDFKPEKTTTSNNNYAVRIGGYKTDENQGTGTFDVIAGTVNLGGNVIFKKKILAQTGDSWFKKIDVNAVIIRDSFEIGGYTHLKAGFNGNGQVMTNLNIHKSKFNGNIWESTFDGAAIFNAGPDLDVKRKLNMWGNGIVNQSGYSKKTNFTPLSQARSLKAILDTDVVQYDYLEGSKCQVGFVINDNGKSPYYTDEILIEDKEYRNDAVLVGHLMLAVKELNRRIEELAKE